VIFFEIERFGFVNLILKYFKHKGQSKLKISNLKIFERKVRKGFPLLKIF